MTVTPEINYLNTTEFNGALSSWKKKVEDFDKAKALTDIARKSVATSDLTIGDLIKGFKTSKFLGNFCIAYRIGMRFVFLWHIHRFD